VADPIPDDEEPQRRAVPWLPLGLGLGLVVLAVLLFMPSDKPAPPPPPPPVASVTPTPEPTPEPTVAATATAVEVTPEPTPEPSPNAALAVNRMDPGERPPTHDAKRDLVAPRSPAPVKQREPAPVVQKEPPPPAEAKNNTPVKDPIADLDPIIAALRRCPTMQSCIQGADTALEMYGNTSRLPDPGIATLANFDEVRSNYRKAQAEALRNAKDLAGRPNGKKHEPQLRSVFEAIPKSDAFVLDREELGPIRAALERLIARWTTERRQSPGSTIGLQVRLLTPAGGRQLEIEFEHAPSTFGGLGELKEYIRKELAHAKEVRSSGRQRLASVKVVVSPGGHHDVD
jgi:hypothetical protein